MIGISYVEHVRSSKDPSKKVTYSVYVLHVRGILSPQEMHDAGEIISEILQAATYQNPELARSVKEPIACFATDVTRIRLILFGEFDAREIMYAIASGRRNLNY